jgi:hypothetical protein
VLLLEAGLDPQPIPDTGWMRRRRPIYFESPYILMYPTKRNFDSSNFILWPAELWAAVTSQHDVNPTAHQSRSRQLGLARQP